MTINLNAEPYNDDYDETKNFYKILFRPSYPVQARELTQLQTILQKQISRHGNHIFKQGAMVVPGQISYDNNAHYVKLQTSYNGVSVESILSSISGQTVVGSSGLTALIIAVKNITSTDPTTIYVRYTNSGTDTTVKVFPDNEVLSCTVGIDVYNFQVQASSATGLGSIVSIETGVYYVNEYFALVEAQSLIIEPYSQTPTYKIGLTISEELIAPEDDDSLLDNASGSYNYSAPGAHRYYIGLTLSTISVTATDTTNFIELMQVDAGVLRKLITTTEYSVLEKTLARRTYDESGDYTVKEFNIDIREHRNNNRGAWASGQTYQYGDIVTNDNKTYIAKSISPTISLTNVPPTHISAADAYDGTGTTGVKWEYNLSPYYNRGIDIDGDESKLAIGIEPGKAYVKGYEIEKIVTEYLPISKARTLETVADSVVSSNVGNFVYVTNIFNLPPVETFDTIQLHDRLSSVLSGTVTVTLGSTALSGGTKFLTELSIGSVIRNAAGLYIGTVTAIASDSAATITAAVIALAGVTTATTIGAKIGTARTRLLEWDSGTVAASNATYKLSLFDIKMNNGFTFNDNVKSFYYPSATIPFVAEIKPILTPKAGLLNVTASTGVANSVSGTKFTTDLKVGNYISISSGGSSSILRVTGALLEATFNTNGTANYSNASYSVVSTSINESNEDILLFPLPFANTKTVRDSSGNHKLSYTVYEKITVVVAGSAISFQVTTTAPNKMLSGENNSNYIITRNDTGAVVRPSNITAYNNITTIDIVSFGASAVTCTVICASTRTGSSSLEKIKTVTLAAVKTVATQADATAQVIYLEQADCYRIKSIMMRTGYATPFTTSGTGNYTVDITGNYDFDTGQRMTHYGIGSISLKAGFLPATDCFKITYEYFSHSSGDYCTVNSYSNALPFDRIQTKDYIDFRPVISTGGAFTSVAVPKRGYDITSLDFKYYLAIKEKIAIDLYGKVFNVEGSPALSPSPPQDPSNGMVIYNLTLSPFTYDTTKDSILVEKTDNKRYTMRDIGKLEKRIDTIEYYTSLSLLEQETQSLKITDSSGLDRLKNGFIVDNFSGHGIGDVTSADYACSIDMEENQLRPSAYVTNVNMIEKLTTDAARLAQHYGLYGDVITLPIIEHIPLVKQGFASRLENINPFAVFTFIGDVKITPSSDDWFEINRLPDIVTDVEGNFSTVSAIAQKAGILGTVWNSWQTVWSGKPVVTSSKTKKTIDKTRKHQSKGTDSADYDYGWIKDITTQQLSTTVNQSRTGVNTKIVTKIDRQVVADRVVSTAVIPYIRSRNILVQVRGLKPSTRFYPYFDNVAISTYCTPASKMVYTLTSPTRNFSAEINSGGNASIAGRKIGTDAQVCLNKGDLIKGSISLATAVVVGVEINGNVRKLHLSNIKGTFVAETITGSILYPGGYATGTIAAGAVTTSAIGSSLTTNLNGDLNLLFNIPNTQIVRFRTGSREFKLIDATVATAPYTSRGIASYRAEGIIESKQASINAVRNAELVQTGTSQNQTIIKTSERIIDSGWYDPLAQSFLVENKGGAFLTKVDVFFATKDSAIPVTIQIREMVNGYPGSRILPFSKVTLKPEDVKLSSTNVLLDGTNYPTFNTPTTFTFPSPVYVEDATNYCIVLVSDSNNYKVWISQLGDDIPGTPNGKISEQPYAGVLFKSQNASTWTADQMQDLKFTIYKAKFDISYTNGVDVEFVNDSLPYSTLETDPIQLITGSNVARIWHNNHGLNVGDTIDMQGIPSSLGGVSDTLFNDTHIVSSVELDSYVINGLTVATSTGYFGGDSVLVSTNVKYVTIQPQVQAQNFSDTNVNYSVTPYNETAIPVVVNDNNTFTKTRSIKSELLDADPKTLKLTVNLKSTNDSLSPVLDTHRLSITAVNNIINYPTYDVSSLTPVDYSEVFNHTTGAFNFSPLSVIAGSFVIGTSYKILSIGTTDFTLIGATNNIVGTVFIAKGVGAGTGTAATSSILTSTVSAVKLLMANILPGQYIKTIATPAYTTNNGVFLVTNFSDDGTTATLTVKDSSVYNKIFVAESSGAGALTVTSYTGNSTTTVTAVASNVGLNVGDTIVISGATGTEQTKLNGTWLISSLPAGGTSFTFVVATAVATGSLTTTLGTITRPIKVSIVNLFNNEIISNGSSSAAKYVSMPVSLALPSTSVKLRFALNNPSVSNVSVYYKTSLSSTVNIDTIKYNYVDPTVAVISVQNGDDAFYDVDYNFTLSPFDTIQIKLVMNSADTAAVPKIKDFRIIALA